VLSYILIQMIRWTNLKCLIVKYIFIYIYLIIYVYIINSLFVVLKVLTYKIFIKYIVNYFNQMDAESELPIHEPPETEDKDDVKRQKIEK